MMANSPVIIVGNARSGTSLLRLMMTCHPAFCIPPEGPFLYMLANRYGAKAVFDEACITAFVDDLMKSPKMGEWQLDDDALKKYLINRKPKSYAEMVRVVYRFYMRQTDQVKRRWGDKSGRYTIHGLDVIKRFFPDAFIIHIVRDGRDVACSYRSLHGSTSRHAPQLPMEPMEIAYEWVRHLELVERFLGSWPKSQQAVIRYEDLVLGPEASLRQLCDLLDEVYDAQMLNFYQENMEKRLEPAVYLGWKQKTLEQVTDSQVGRWRTELSEEQVTYFEGIAYHLLERYGYETTALTFPQVHIRWFYLQKQISRLVTIGKKYIYNFNRN